MTEPGAEVEEELDEPLRWPLLAVFVVVIVAGFALALWLTLTWTSDCAEIGGRTTDVAGDSMRAQLCESGRGAAVALIPVGWVAGLALATFALLRWEGGVRGTVLLMVLFLAPALLPAAAYGGLSRSSTSCPDDERAAYREWVDAGSEGTAPYDCRTF